MNLSGNKNSGIGITPGVIIAGIGIIVGGFLIGLLTPSLFPVQGSSEATQIDQLYQWLLAIGGAVFLLVQGLLIYSIIRFRAKPGDTEDGPAIHGNATLELIWTAIPAVIVIFLVIYSFSVWQAITEPKNDELVVQGIGQRFNWNFTYTDPLNRLSELDTQTFSDSVLHTYVGRPILLELETRDVNHSFWVPAMRMKQDLIAGRTTTVRFTPIEAGEYRIVCTELCGGGHGQMYSYINVYETEDEWMTAFVDPSVDLILNPPADPVVQGANILANNTYPCSGCHVLEDDEYGLAWAGVTGPSLNVIGSTATRRASDAGLTDAVSYLAQSIRHPNAYIVPGFNAGLMPQFGPFSSQPDDWDPSGGAGYQALPDEDLYRILSYLCTRTEDGSNACGEDAEQRETNIRDAISNQNAQF